MSLILASNSQIRRAMLEQAGLRFETRSPDFDEESAKQKGFAGEQLVRVLAEGKAASLAAEEGSWVIGSDSSVTVGGTSYSKPHSREEAAAHLRSFSGEEMLLSSGVALARRGQVEWSHAETARLRFRELSDVFIEQYLDEEWPEVGYCVGVFRLEGRGVNLFETMDGNYFTVLGMPLLPLLGELRKQGLMPS